MRDHQQTHILEPISTLGGVLAQLFGEFGHRPVPVPVLSGLPVPSVRALLRRCRRIWKAARHSMLTNQNRVQCVANQRRVPVPAYRPGQRVWLLAKDLPLPTLSRKLAPRYVGPYTIERVVNPSALRLQLPPSLKVHPVFHVSQVKPVAASALSPILCSCNIPPGGYKAPPGPDVIAQLLFTLQWVMLSSHLSFEVTSGLFVCLHFKFCSFSFFLCPQFLVPPALFSLQFPVPRPLVSPSAVITQRPPDPQFFTSTVTQLPTDIAPAPCTSLSLVKLHPS